jgi:hypothetical protein
MMCPKRLVSVKVPLLITPIYTRVTKSRDTTLALFLGVHKMFYFCVVCLYTLRLITLIPFPIIFLRRIPEPVYSPFAETRESS